MRVNRIQGLRTALISALLTLCVTVHHAHAASSDDAPTNIDKIMYFDADIRDAEYCQFSITDKVANYGNKVTNPAMTCPDAFSWNLFAEVIADEFWKNWADESQNWPEQPWPMCSESITTNCCNPASNNNNLEHCPVYPGDELAQSLKKAESFTNDNKIIRGAKNQRNAISTFFQKHSDIVRVGTARQKGKRGAVNLADTQDNPECTSSQIDSVLPADPQSIGRILRQTNAEITIRNKTFHDYLFNNNLYNADGVLDVYRQNANNQTKNAPYHQSNQSGTPSTPGKLSTVDLPPDAIMIKSNWVSEKVIDAIKNKYPKQYVHFGKANDYITKPAITILNTSKGKCNVSDTHYLMAFHISSKDVPQWVWTTFEHMNNPGRCDYTGCNDSFGHSVTVDNAPSNYIVPNQKNDNLSESSIVFDPDLQYPMGNQSEALTQLLTAYGIATSDRNGLYPNPSDKAWVNYRLKGSQVDFTDHQGRATHLGNSITEAGFMSQSSCIGCHSRAGVAMKLSAIEGKITYDISDHLKATALLKNETANFLQLGVFESVLSEFGYEQSHDGIPKHDWFYNDDPSFSLKVLQTDFIWGFLNANPLPQPEVTIEVKQTR